MYPLYLYLLLLIPLTIFLAIFGRRAVSNLRFWGGLALRIFLMALIIFALAGTQLQLPSQALTAVFVLDASDSISVEDKSHGEEVIREAIQKMPSGDRAAIVVFGEDALVERLANEESSLAKLTSVPVSTRTDIASALQLAMALFPGEGSRRIVLLSDGRENLSYAMKQAELAAIQEIEMQYVPLGQRFDQVEVMVNSLQAPSATHEGQELDLEIRVESTVSIGASLRVLADDELIYTQEVALNPGLNLYRVPVKNSTPGFRRFRAQVEPDADNWLQNNEASAFTIVHGPPRVLLAEGTPGDGENLAGALASAQVDVTRRSADDLPVTLAELAQYDAVILANVPAAELSSGIMDALPVYVRDLGKGLLMTGGENAFGAGGYLRTPVEEALPVFMDVKSRELAANLALIVAVDKSGSMGRCHCDNPDLNQTYTAMETGQPKVDIAKEAIMRSASALGNEDYLGVVTFDSQARWALTPQLLPGQNALENAIGNFQAQGQTNMFTGVSEAYKALEEINAKRKHIILMTDGWVRTGELNSLAKDMLNQGITLSVIAAGEGSAEYLKALAEDGGGRYYPAVDMMSVPDVFLKETVKSIGQYIIEEPFYPLPASPSPVFRGIDENTLPALSGYNGTSPKNTARLDLLTPRGDPLLASWQYGLGRAAVWTSDLKGRWASDWVQWEQFPRFSAQLIAWLLPAPQIEGVDAKVSMADTGAIIRVEAKDELQRPLNDLDIEARLIDPGLNTTEAALVQVGPGEYEITSRLDQPGTYLIWLGITKDKEPLGQMNLGLVVPYSPEYRSGGVDFGFLEELVRVTGGRLLEEPANAFLHNLPAQESAKEIWRVLLFIATLIFPIDVAVRRLTISRRDFDKGLALIASRLTIPKAGTGSTEPQILGRLFIARQRARKQSQKAKIHVTAAQEKSGADSEEPPTEIQELKKPEDEEFVKKFHKNEQDSLSRLREAKKRAKR